MADRRSGRTSQLRNCAASHTFASEFTIVTEKVSNSRRSAMRMTALICVGIAMAWAAFPVGSQDKVSSPSNEADGPARKISELQHERIETMKELVALSNNLAKSYRVELGDALEARMTLLRAELDVAENGLDRITLCKDALDSMKYYEEIEKAFKEAGRGPRVNEFKVKAMRLEIEIMLEQEQMKTARDRK